MLSIFNNKGIKLTAKTVDEDIEKAGVASRNIVMKKQYTLFWSAPGRHLGIFGWVCAAPGLQIGTPF